MRLVLLCSGVLLAGCRGSLLNRYDESQKPQVDVQHTVATDPPAILRTPPDAASVEVRDAETNRVMWRIEQGGGPHGPSPVRSPLTYGSGAPRHINPPDNAEPRFVAGPEPLGPDRVYKVTVHRYDLGFMESGGGFTGVRPNTYETTGEFRTLNTIPLDGQ